MAKAFDVDLLRLDTLRKTKPLFQYNEPLPPVNNIWKSVGKGGGGE